MTSIEWISAPGLLWLLALWLRLRWQAQQQRERHRYLEAIARALSDGGHIDEGYSDGSWSRLAVRRPWSSKGDGG